MNYSTNGTAMRHHTQPLTEGELRVPQYGPEWVAHVAAGGRVREGNILIFDATPILSTPLLTDQL